MQTLLPRYAASLEERRERLFDLYETYIQQVLQGHSPDYIAQIALPDGRIISVVPLLYSQANLGISPPPPPYEHAGWFFDVWMYETPVKALLAALSWDGQGEPEGWWRHPATGRRRPGGDPAKQYISG